MTAPPRPPEPLEFPGIVITQADFDRLVRELIVASVASPVAPRTIVEGMTMRPPE